MNFKRFFLLLQRWENKIGKSFISDCVAAWMGRKKEIVEGFYRAKENSRWTQFTQSETGSAQQSAAHSRQFSQQFSWSFSSYVQFSHVEIQRKLVGFMTWTRCVGCIFITRSLGCCCIECNVDAVWWWGGMRGMVKSGKCEWTAKSAEWKAENYE